MHYSEKISKQLNRLLVKNYDAEKSYLSAAENVENRTLIEFFVRKSVERRLFAQDIKREILRYGKEPKTSGSLMGDLHKISISLRAMFASNNVDVILQEAVKRDVANLAKYNDVLKDRILPTRIVTLLVNQKNAIEIAIASRKFEMKLIT